MAEILKGSQTGVLVALSNKQALRHFAECLNKVAGYQMWIALDRQDAARVVAEVPYPFLSFMIVDISDQSMRGDLLLQKVREEPKHRLVEVLIASDKPSPEERVLLRELGLEQNILPPDLGQFDLFRLIEKSLRHHEMQQEKRTWVVEIETAILEGNRKKALQLIGGPLFQRLLAEDPELTVHLADVHLIAREAVKALEILTQFLRRKGEMGKAEALGSLAALARALSVAGRHQEALEVNLKLEKKSPRNLAHRIAAGDELLLLGHAEEASKRFAQVLSEDPDHIFARIGEARVAFVRGRLEQGIQILKKIEGRVESVALADAINAAAKRSLEEGKVDAALKLYEDAIPLFDKHRAHIYYHLGLIRLKMGAVVSACKCFDAVIQDEAGQIYHGKPVIQEYMLHGADAFKPKAS